MLQCMADINKKLIGKFFTGTATGREAEKVLDWFETNEGQLYLKERINFDTKKIKKVFPESSAANRTFENILESIENQKTVNQALPVVSRKKSIWLAAASIAVLVISLSVFLAFKDSISESVNQVDQYTVYSTNIGEQRLLTLTDGSQIRLNENSSIEIPVFFRDDLRSIRLYGEAYFNVQHDELRPFIVQTGELEIRVLGTEFIVKSDDFHQTTLVAVADGSVSFGLSGEQPGTFTVINRNMVGFYNHTNDLFSTEHLDVRNYLSWINSRIVFEGMYLSDVVRQLGYIYGMEHQLLDEKLNELRLTANISSNSKMDVLETIAHSLDIDFLITNDRVQWELKTAMD